MIPRVCTHRDQGSDDWVTHVDRLERDLLAEAEQLADDPDWCTREWAAVRARRACVQPGGGPAPHERVGRWRQLRDRLATDPHPHVSTAANPPPRTPGMRRAMDPSAALEFYTSGVPMPDGEVLGWRADERLAVAQAGQGNIPAGLLADPDCDIRAAAARNIATSALDDTTLARLRADPCPWVRAAVLHRCGPDPSIPVDQLPDQERLVAARMSQDPATLAVLAHDARVDVRLEVARNVHCPTELLPHLARHPVVFGAALANPALPPGVRPPDPFAPAGR